MAELTNIQKEMLQIVDQAGGHTSRYNVIGRLWGKAPVVQMYHMIRLMEEDGLIAVVNENGIGKVSLTEAGRQELKK